MRKLCILFSRNVKNVQIHFWHLKFITCNCHFTAKLAAGLLLIECLCDDLRHLTPRHPPHCQHLARLRPRIWRRFSHRIVTGLLSSSLPWPKVMIRRSSPIMMWRCHRHPFISTSFERWRPQSTQLLLPGWTWRSFDVRFYDEFENLVVLLFFNAFQLLFFFQAL